MRLQGQVLSIQRSAGSFVPDDAPAGTLPRPYDNQVYRILDVDTVRKVKVKSTDPQPGWKVGDQIDVRVTCSDAINLSWAAEASSDGKPLRAAV
jgi:hypothetical protein